MNVAKLNTLWDADDRTAEANLARFDRVHGLNLVVGRTGGGPPQRCPECDSIIYSRRHRLCGRCGSELPSACLFSGPEAARVEAVLRREQAQHRLWLQRASQPPGP